MKPLLYLAAFFAILDTNVAVASGQEFLGWCKSASQLQYTGSTGSTGNEVDAGVCMGYVMGVYQTLLVWESSPWNAGNGPKPDIFVCPPPGTGYGQMVDVFLKYLETNPSRLQEDEFVLIWDALREAFPCK